MAYTDIHAAATREDSSLRHQVAVACFKAAVDITNESASTTNHANRLAWANAVLSQDGASPDTEARRWIWKVLENATIQTSPASATDNDAQFVVNAIVDDMADAYAA